MGDHLNWGNLIGLAWLLPLGGVIVALYLLKMRRRDLKVPATFLWPAQTTEVRANSLFQKLKFSWLLLLQLLALALVVLAFARPQILERGLGGQVTVLVVDVSASMQATDVRGTRLGEALRLAKDVVAGAKSGDRISLIEAGPSPRVVFSQSNDPDRMRRLIDQIQPTDAEADVGEALRLAASISRKQGKARVILLSDGVFAPIENFPVGAAELTFVKVGDRSRNAAITGFGISDNGRQLYGGVRNFGLDATNGVLNFFADGKLVDSWRWEAKANQTVGHLVTVPAGARLFEARLEHDDFLKSDNYAVAVGGSGDRIRALLVTKGNLFLERALALDPRVELEKSAQPPTQGEWDLVVYDDVPEANLPAKAVLTLGKPGPRSPVVGEGQIPKPGEITQENVKVLNGVNLRQTYLDEIAAVRAKDEGEVLAEVSSGGRTYPLVVASQAGGRRSLFVGFAPMKSDFPLQVGFPVFIANAIEYLLPARDRRSELLVQAGRPFSLPAPKPSPLSLVDPSGKRTLINALGGAYVVRDTKRVGKYTLGDRTIYASLRSDVESNIAPQDNLRVGGETVASGVNLARLSDHWRWLIALALFVLVVEWVVFARRS